MLSAIWGVGIGEIAILEHDRLDRGRHVSHDRSRLETAVDSFRQEVERLVMPLKRSATASRARSARSRAVSSIVNGTVLEVLRSHRLLELDAKMTTMRAKASDGASREGSSLAQRLHRFTVEHASSPLARSWMSSRSSGVMKVRFRRSKIRGDDVDFMLELLELDGALFETVELSIIRAVERSLATLRRARTAREVLVRDQWNRAPRTVRVASEGRAAIGEATTSMESDFGTRQRRTARAPEGADDCTIECTQLASRREEA